MVAGGTTVSLASYPGSVGYEATVSLAAADYYIDTCTTLPQLHKAGLLNSRRLSSAIGLLSIILPTNLAEGKIVNTGSTLAPQLLPFCTVCDKKLGTRLIKGGAGLAPDNYIGYA